jgi:hypothetical protein
VGTRLLGTLLGEQVEDFVRGAGFADQREDPRDAVLVRVGVDVVIASTAKDG